MTSYGGASSLTEAIAWTVMLVMAVAVVCAKKDVNDQDRCRDVETNSEQKSMEEILNSPDPFAYSNDDPDIVESLQQLQRIYRNKIYPIEKQFHYSDLSRHVMSDADIYSKPIVLVVGPWSTGKSTMLNYMLGIEDSPYSLHTGAEPTTTDFYVLTYGNQYRKVDGVVLATDGSQAFAWTEKFGQSFIRHLYGIEMPAPLLRNVTIVDTPGLFENRIQPKRGYPHDKVMQWLVRRADMVIVVFDPTKLEVGDELVQLFEQLKGREATFKIVLNKADTMEREDLLRIYGAFMWTLSPLVNFTDPPSVYLGSYWSRSAKYRNNDQELIDQERQLIYDIRHVIRNRIYSKIAFVRQYAIRVKMHVLLVDSYVTAFRRNAGLFTNSKDVADRIVHQPDKYDIIKTMLANNENISAYDLPDANEYAEFFHIHKLSEHKRLADICSMFYGCPAIDRLNEAINDDLPKLLAKYQHLKINAGPNPSEEACFAGNKRLPTFLPKYHQRVGRRGKKTRFSTKTTSKSVTTTNRVSTTKANEAPAESSVQNNEPAATANTIAADSDAATGGAFSQMPTAEAEKATRDTQHVTATAPPTTASISTREEQKQQIPQSQTTTATTVKIATATVVPAKVKDLRHTDTLVFERPAEEQQEMDTRLYEEQKLISPVIRNLTVASTSKTTVSVKCNKYRKSCRLHQLLDKPEPIMIRYAVNVGRSPPKCKLYRKSCKGQNATAQTPLSSVINGAERMAAFVDEAAASSSFFWKLTTLLVPNMVSTTSTAVDKPCIRYRKSCKDRQSKIVMAPPLDSQQIPGGQLPPRTQRGAQPCKLYRKSCRRDQKLVDRPTTAAMDEQQSRNATLSQKAVKETRGSTANKNASKNGRTNQSTDEPKGKKSASTSANSSSKKKNAKATKAKAKKTCSKKKSNKSTAADRSFVIPQTLKLSCNRYRKSCQEEAKKLLLAKHEQATQRVNDSSFPTTPSSPPTVISAAGQSIRTATTRPPTVKCSRYRKTCKHESLAPISIPDIVAKRPTPKCPKYRKSCNASTPVILKPSAATEQQATMITIVTEQDLRDIKPSVSKCNRYRLSCQKLMKGNASNGATPPTTYE